MWQMLAAGSSIFSSLASYGADKAKAKAERAFQQYKNKMTQLSNAMSQNAITNNELISNEQFNRQALEIQLTGQEAAGAINVQAGSTYTAGRSVSRSLRQVEISRSMAETVRKENLINSWNQSDTERKNAAMNAAMNTDYSYIPKPSLSSYLFDAVGKVSSIYG